jgi:hypothetical protein
MGLKKVPYKLIDRNENPEVYELMDELIAAHHPDLASADARIALAWRLGWKPSSGKLKLGMCRLAADIDAALHGYDFIILLNSEVWKEFSDTQRRALLDHELCHAGVCKDKEGEIKQDENSRAVFGLVKHDLEEFVCIVERYGCYLQDIEVFAKAALAKADKPLLKAWDAGDFNAQPRPTAAA